MEYWRYTAIAWGGVYFEDKNKHCTQKANSKYQAISSNQPTPEVVYLDNLLSVLVWYHR